MIGRGRGPDKRGRAGTSARARALTRRVRGRPTRNGGRIAAAGVALLAALQAGCLVEIHHLADPDLAFRAAREEATRDAGRHGRAHRLNVLVFDPDDGEVVRVSLPLWLARRVQGHIHLGGNGDDDALGRRLARNLRVEDLAAAGPAVIADVEEEDGGQVLVWLR